MRDALIFSALLPGLSAAGIWYATRPKTAPRDPRVWQLLVEAEVKLEHAIRDGGDAGDAIALFKRVLAIAPDLPEPTKFIGIALVYAKKPNEGLAHLLKFLEKDPNDAEANLWAARGYKVEGNSDIAFLYYERARALDREDVEARKELGKLYLERRKPLEAASVLQEAVALAPKDEELTQLLSTAMNMQTALARDIETRGGLTAPELGPAAPNPLASIEASKPKVPKP